MDLYKNFKELCANERKGHDYLIDSTFHSSGICILAPHGGGIEPGTSELAAALALKGKYSCYLFDGIKRKGNASLHITSTCFDEPGCIELLKKTAVAIAVHGSGDDDAVIDIGGLNEGIMVRLRDFLVASGFNAVIDTSPGHNGMDKRNICNKCFGGRGVQIEFPMRVREALFRDVRGREGRAATTGKFESLISSMADALEKAPRGCCIE